MRVIESCYCGSEVEIKTSHMEEVDALLTEWRTNHPHRIPLTGGQTPAEFVFDQFLRHPAT